MVLILRQFLVILILAVDGLNKSNFIASIKPSVILLNILVIFIIQILLNFFVNFKKNFQLFKLFITGIMQNPKL